MQTTLGNGASATATRPTGFKRKFTVSFLAIFAALALLGGVSARVLAVASDAPTDLTATPYDSQVDLSWTAPVNPGDSPISDYIIEYSLSGANDWQTFADSESTDTTTTVTDLTNGTAYDFRVSAVNATDTSPPSAIATTTPAAPIAPDAPTDLNAASDNEQVNLTWTAPEDVGSSPITDYIVQYSENGTDWTQIADEVSTDTSTTVTELTNGTLYYFEVSAVNDAGPGPASAVSTATPAAAPDAPTDVVATRGNASATVTFTAPTNDGGSPITNYVVHAHSTGGDVEGDGTASPITVTGLSNGTAYTFTVHAVNEVGNGPESDSSNSVTPATVPGAPTVGTATLGNGSATVTFTAPASNGGSPITGYTVTSNDGKTGTGTSSPITVSGLTNGTAYTFTVKATNAVGAGAASGASNSITPATVPGAPTIGTASSGNGQVIVGFIPPADNGGSPITSYTVTSDPGGKTATGSGAPLAVTGLTNGTAYTFTVTATNAVGTSSPSAMSGSSTPHTVAGAPTDVTAVSGDSAATVSFTAPADNGGALITRYTVTSTPGNLSNTGATSPITVSGLTNGTAYTFKVTATNVAGPGAASSASNSVTPAAAPDAPTGLTAAPDDRQVGLSWSAPASDGGLAITDYAVEYSVSGADDWTVFSDGVSAATSATVTGLTNGTAYDFRVSAVTSVGQGLPSDSATSTPRTTPDAPTIGTATPGNGAATVSFTAPANDGGSDITSYTVTSSPGGKMGTSATSPITVTGLANGTAYTFTVVATNAAGDSVASAATTSITPRTVPDAPTDLSAVAGNAQATVSFTTPANNGGAAITTYTVTSTPGNITKTGATSPITVTGLTNGTAYTFTVKATNIAGDSVASSASSGVTPATVPDAPTIGTATPNNGSVSVAFTAPANNGGSPITGYTVTSNPGGFIGTGTTSPITVSGLTNGVTYTFTVKATNAVGTSVASGATANTAPRTVPGAPTGVSATRGDSKAVVSFTAPTDNGGSAVTGYTVTSSPGGKIGTGAGSPITVNGLTNGTAYTFTVTANNVAGSSNPSSASGSVTPATVPGAPTELTAASGVSQVGLSWTAPASNGGSAITDYIVQYSVSDADSWTTFADGTSTATTALVTGLANGTAYDFRVSAVNAMGTGTVSALVTNTPRTIPSAPTGLTATYGNAQVSLSWTTPADNGGDAITDYVVEDSLSGANDWTIFADGTSTATTATVTGLLNGTAYDFRVSAVNSAGPSVPSATATATPVLPVTVISAVSATPADDSVVIAWTTDLGASSQVEYGPDTSYGMVTPITDATGTRPTSHSVTLSDLNPCVTYDYRVISQPVAGAVTTSDNDTVTTTGCTGDAAPVGEQVAAVPTTGGEVALASSLTDGASIDVSAPAGYTPSDTVIQIKQFGSLPTSATGMPGANFTSVGSQVYDIRAVTSSGDLVTDFDQPITITLHYTDAEIAGLTESSLVLYHWHDGAWQPLTGSTVNGATNTVTGTTTQFSLFALFGVAKPATTPGSPTGSNSSSNGVGSTNEGSANSDETANTTPDTSTPDQSAPDHTTGVSTPNDTKDTDTTKHARSGHVTIWLWAVITVIVIIVIIWIIAAAQRRKRS